MKYKKKNRIWCKIFVIHQNNYLIKTNARWFRLAELIRSALKMLKYNLPDYKSTFVRLISLFSLHGVKCFALKSRNLGNVVDCVSSSNSKNSFSDLTPPVLLFSCILFLKFFEQNKINCFNFHSCGNRNNMLHSDFFEHELIPLQGSNS